MSIVVLALGTVFSIIFLILLFKGSRYDYMIEPLDSDVYPLKFFYSAGFALQDVRVFRLRGKLGGRLRNTASLYYGKKFGEFYARAIWAQMLSYIPVCVSLLFLIAGLFSGEMCGFFALVGGAGGFGGLLLYDLPGK